MSAEEGLDFVTQLNLQILGFYAERESILAAVELGSALCSPPADSTQSARNRSFRSNTKC